MGSSTNRALIAKSEKARAQSVEFAIRYSPITPSIRPEMRELSARVSMFAEHFDCITVCEAGAARNAGELQRKKAGGLPMGQQFTNAERTNRYRGGALHDASKGWR